MAINYIYNLHVQRVMTHLSVFIDAALESRISELERLKYLEFCGRACALVARSVPYDVVLPDLKGEMDEGNEPSAQRCVEWILCTLLAARPFYPRAAVEPIQLQLVMGVFRCDASVDALTKSILDYLRE